jgi:hypothetical protein
MTKMVNMFVLHGVGGGAFMVEDDVRNLMARTNAATILDAFHTIVPDKTDDQYIIDFQVWSVSENEARSFGAML